MRVDLVNALGDVAAGVLLLLHLPERLGIGTFDPDEHREEICFLHQLQKLFVVGQIERGFGGELERMIVLLVPGLEMRQERLHGFLVADQIVVDEIHMAAVAEPVERIELRQHLLGGLGARHAPV